MRVATASLTALVGAILAGCSGAPATPQASAPPPTNYAADNAEFFGRSVKVPAGCPMVQWDLGPDGTTPGAYKGMAYFTDLSGISYITGTVGQDGKVTGDVRSVYGKGPQGTITGQRSDNGVLATVNGTGCSAIQIDLPAHHIQGGRG